MTNDQVKVCVVSLIGKSQFRQDRNKAWKLNSLVQKNVFKSDPKLKEKFLKKVEEASKNQPSDDQDVKSDQKEEETGKSTKAKTYDHNIQTYHDQKNRVIYVHLESIFDTNNIYEILIKNQQNIEEQKNFYEQWEAEQLKYLKSVLLIFSISHIVIISNPSCEIDITYIRFFRLIDTLRNKLMPSLVELLKSLDLPICKDWIYAARPCSPRVLFTFENCPRSLLLDPNSNQVIEKFQHALEDQIYNSLRKSYVITNISNNSIFAIPANQEFVYVHRSSPESTNINKLLMSNIEFNKTIASTAQASSQQRQPYSAHPLVPNPQQNKQTTISASNSSDMDSKLFREFVFAHIRTALNDGFNDNIGRTNVVPVFELPTSETWYRVYEALGDFFLAEPVKNTKLAIYYSQLKSQIDLDVQFSENRCKKLLQPALGLYQENLPSHYNKLQHQQRLEKALSLYQTNARGPMYNHYLEQLKRECTNVWTNGRQLCEAVSLTGHNCVLEVHRVPPPTAAESTTTDDDENRMIAPTESDSASTVLTTATTATATSEDESSSYRSASSRGIIIATDDSSLPSSVSSVSTKVKRSRSNRTVSGSGRLTTATSATNEREIKVRPHTSNIVTVAASNCGLFQRERKDPFDLKDANFNFYEEFAQMSELIPRQVSLVKYEFPVFKPSVLNAKPAEKPYECNQQTTMLAPTTSVSQSTQQQAQAELSVNINLSQDNNTNINSKSPLNLGNNNSEPNQVVIEKTTPQHQPHQLQEKVQEKTLDEEKNSTVVINTEVYLNGMTHSDSPAGLLPRFSSWSLMSIGKYTDYNPHNGLSQPGFMANLNYLIPWEMIVSNNTVTSLHDKSSSRKKAPSESSDNRQQQLKRTGTPNVTIRAFIGAEYECPCGHRFICSGPDRPVRLSNNGVVKDDAYKLLNMDMPLYTACPCRNSKDSTPYMAQLMRIFVVTPPGNIQTDEEFVDNLGQKLCVSIRPRVQPNPTPCPVFWPSRNEPITLADNSIWVLRLPYIYMGDDGRPYSRPTDFETLNNCKVLKGMFSVSLFNS